MSAYGHIYVSSSAETTFVEVDVYQKVAGTTTIKASLNMDMPADGRLRYTGDQTRPCLVEASFSASADFDTVAFFALAKSGVVDEDTEVQQSLDASGDSEAFSLRSIVSLSEDDYIEIWVKTDEEASVTVEKLTLVAVAT